MGSISWDRLCNEGGLVGVFVVQAEGALGGSGGFEVGLASGNIPHQSLEGFSGSENCSFPKVMSIWFNKEHRTYLDDAEDFAYGPSGGRVKQWLAGVVLASLPIVYGGICVHRGHTVLPGGRGGSLDLKGDDGFWLAVSYIAIGAFVHFHYFWGLSARLWRFSQFMKVGALLVFLASFLRALYGAFQ